MDQGSLPNQSSDLSSLSAMPTLSTASDVREPTSENQGLSVAEALQSVNDNIARLDGILASSSRANSAVDMCANQSPLESSAPLSGAVVAEPIEVVPAFLVDMVRTGEFVELTLLSPRNLESIPKSRPSESDLEKLVKTLRPIDSFATWLEAWNVYVSLSAFSRPHKVLFCQFCFYCWDNSRRFLSGILIHIIVWTLFVPWYVMVG